MDFLKQNRLWVIMLSLVLGLMIYGSPRPVHETYTVSWIDEQEKTVTKTATVILDGSYYHRLMDTDVVSGKLTIEGQEYYIIMPNYGYGGLMDGMDRKWGSPGIKATLLRNSTYLGWITLSKDYKQLSGYFDSDKSEGIIFAGPAKTYEETKAVFDMLDY